MNLTEVKEMSTVERYCYWIKEREAIRKARLLQGSDKQERWTDDPILHQYRFCNVVRMDDKVSKWILENWYKPNYNHSNMLPAIGLARFFNKPETLEVIGFPKSYNPQRIYKKLREYQNDTKQPVFNGAYIVCGRPGEEKIKSVLDYVDALHKGRKKLLDTDSIEHSVANLNGSYGVGSFMAGQIVADARWAVAGTWADRLKWAAIGPGSKRGMNRIHNRSDIDKPIKQPQFTMELNDLIRRSEKVLFSQNESIYLRMEAIDWQNCLCEYDKYCRTLFSEGKPKQWYKRTTT